MLPILYNGTGLATQPTNRLANLFDRFFNDDVFAPTGAALPLALWQDEDRVYVEADLPGMTEQDVELTVHQGDLIIRGERKCERQEGGCDYRRYGRFEQRVTLPEQVSADQVEAKLVNGVLKVTLPKTPESKPRRIAIKGE